MRTELSTLNSATKYPSIPTYHALGDRGGLTDEAVTFSGGPVILTEKVDGTNGRIVLLPDGDWLIGSREELLHAKGDRVFNPALGIVEALRPLAERLKPREGPGITVFFLEVYGHRIGGAAKQYTADGNVGQRLFDIAHVPVEVLDRERGQVAAWRDGGGQRWFTEEELQETAGAEGLAVTPRVATLDASELPTGVEEMHAFLGRRLPTTRVALDDRAGRTPEGIVLRDGTRSVIAKARFQDYERTLKRRR